LEMKCGCLGIVCRKLRVGVKFPPERRPLSETIVALSLTDGPNEKAPGVASRGFE